MLNLRLRILIFLSLVTFTPFSGVSQSALAKDTAPLPYEVISIKTLDRKSQVLQAYLEKYNSPLKYQAESFIKAAEIYQLDWRLVAAISGVESTFGKFIPGGFNAWGWGVYGNQAIYFKSWREGIFTVSEGLRTNYFNKGLDNPYTINRIYAASPSWGYKVAYFLEDMKKFEQEYNRQNPELIAFSPPIQTAGFSAQIALNLP